MATTSTPIVPIQEIHVGDAGLNFDTVVYDQTGKVMNISTATKTEFIFQKPDNTLFTVQARFMTDGTDGVLRYTTSSTDFNQAGTWRQQVHLVMGPVELWSNVGKFKVYPNLPLS